MIDKKRWNSCIFSWCISPIFSIIFSSVSFCSSAYVLRKEVTSLLRLLALNFFGCGLKSALAFFFGLQHRPSQLFLWVFWNPFCKWTRGRIFFAAVVAVRGIMIISSWRTRLSWRLSCWAAERRDWPIHVDNGRGRQSGANKKLWPGGAPVSNYCTSLRMKRRILLRIVPWFGVMVLHLTVIAKETLPFVVAVRLGHDYPFSSWRRHYIPHGTGPAHMFVFYFLEVSLVRVLGNHQHQKSPCFGIAPNFGQVSSLTRGCVFVAIHHYSGNRSLGRNESYKRKG